jgi:hypothetical protein
MTMLTNTNLVLAIALVMGAGSFASAAQTDGDNNRVPGAQTQVTGSLASAFASARVPATVRHSGTRSMGGRPSATLTETAFPAPTNKFVLQRTRPALCRPLIFCSRG